MTITLDRYVHWRADLHLLSSQLPLAGLIIVHRLKQPAWRMAVARSIVAGLATLAVVVAAPGWLRTAWPQWPGEEAAPTPRTAMLPIELDISTRPDLARLSVKTPIAVAPPVSEPVAQGSMQVRSTPILTLPGWRSMLLAAYAIG